MPTAGLRTRHRLCFITGGALNAWKSVGIDDLDFLALPRLRQHAGYRLRQLGIAHPCLRRAKESVAHLVIETAAASASSVMIQVLVFLSVAFVPSSD